MSSKKMVDLTKGDLPKKIITFALPLFLASFIQLLYTTVDIIYVGRCLGKDAAAAVGSSSMLITCLVGLFGGLSLGASVVASNMHGARDNNGVHRSIQTAYIISVVSGVVVTVLGLILAPWFIDVIGTPVDIRHDSILYLRFYFYGVFFLVTYNMNAGIIRAFGDSKSPMTFQLVGGIINVFADAFFIFVCKMGVDGVALATLFSQGIPSLLTFHYLQKRISKDISLNIFSLEFDVSILKRILKIGIPAGCQTLVIALSNVVAQYHINSIGTDTIAAFTAYFKIELLLYYPIVAFGQVATTLVGQNMGAKKYERIKDGTKMCLLISMGVTFVTGIVLLALGEYAFGIFVKEQSVIEVGLRIIKITFPFYFIYSILEIYGDSIRGTGNSFVPMIIIMTNICVIRSVILFVFVPMYSCAETIAVSYPITWSLTAVAMFVYYKYSPKMKNICWQYLEGRKQNDN